MPDKDSEPVRPENDEKEKEAVIPAPPATPPLPETKFPIQFNQQVNFYQIPQNAWDRLSPQQTMDLTKLVLEQADATDRRHFEYAMNQARLDDRGKKLAMILGAIIARGPTVETAVLRAAEGFTVY